MNVLCVVLFLFVYMMIGMIFAGAIDGVDCKEDDWIIFFALFWPVILAVLLLIGMLSLPLKLGMWIKKKIDKLG